MGLVSRVWDSADDSWRRVCRQSANRNYILDPGIGLGAGDQWGGVAGIIRGVTGYLLIRHPDAGAEGVTMLSLRSSSWEGCAARLGRALFSSPGGDGRYLRG